MLNLFLFLILFFCVLQKIKESFVNSYDNSKNYLLEMIQDSRVNVNMSENFDVNMFNIVYEENKINYSRINA